MKTNEQGFTLVELIVTLAISGLILALITTVFFEMSSISGSGNDHLTVWHELQNVNDRLETDCQSALTATGGSSLTLSYPSSATVTYTLSGTKLLRTAGINVFTLAQNISSLNFGVNGRLVTMNITSTITGRTGSSEQISSLVSLRPSAP
jgi:prepilin-type N-terminal cleavage/methylation domain-containing protein